MTAGVATALSAALLLGKGAEWGGSPGWDGRMAGEMLGALAGCSQWVHPHMAVV